MMILANLIIILVGKLKKFLKRKKAEKVSNFEVKKDLDTLLVKKFKSPIPKLIKKRQVSSQFRKEKL